MEGSIPEHEDEIGIGEIAGVSAPSGSVTPAARLLAPISAAYPGNSPERKYRRAQSCGVRQRRCRIANPGLILGLDQGSTGSKAIVVDHAGELVASAYHQIETRYPRDGWVEHDATDIWKSVESCLRDLKVRVDFGRVASIGITNQRETCIIWDSKTGAPMTPAISWQCTRSIPIVESWEPLRGEVLEKTGLGLSAYYSASEIKWMFDAIPGLHDRCATGEYVFGTVDTWLIWNLTGGRSHRTDSRNAGRTMFFDIARNCWDERLLDAMGIPSGMLAEVQPSDGDFGSAAFPSDVFARPIPITACLGDQQSAVFGQACFSDGDAKCTIGTCVNLGLNSGQRIDRGIGVTPSIGWSRGGHLTYNLEGGVFVAGSLFAWIQNQLQLVGSFNELITEADQVPGSDGLFFVPAFTGLGAPHWDKGARGTIVGMSFSHGKAHFLRAAVESVVLQTNDVIASVEKDFGIRVKELRADGGVSKSDSFLQTFADITGCVVRRPVNADRTPMGAIYMSGLSVGFWKDMDELKGLWRQDKEFSPRMEEGRRRALLSGWGEAVERAKGWIGSRRADKHGE